MPRKPTANSALAGAIAKQIIAAGEGVKETGEIMMITETLVALLCLYVTDGSAAKAVGMLDALHESTTRRIMMIDGKPY